MVAMADLAPNLHTDIAGGASGSFVDGDLASRIFAQSQSFGTIDVGAVNAALSSLGGRDGHLAGSVFSDVDARLTPVEQGQLAAEADIVVTAERRPVSDAEIAAYDQASQERPTDEVAFSSTRDLDVAEGYFHAQQGLTGPRANDTEIQSRFDAYRAELEGRERVANAVADRAVLDVVKAVLPPVDTATALYRTGVNGEYTLENGITIGAAALGGVVGAVGRGVATRGAAELPSGSFSIADWSNYPAGIPRPEGPFRFLEGAEYEGARVVANKANATIRRERGLVGQAVEVHEIKPVKFGGSATDPANKFIVDRNVHRQQITPWWNGLQRDLAK